MYNAGSVSTDNPEFFIKRYDSGSEVGIGSLPKVTGSSISSHKHEKDILEFKDDHQIIPELK